MNRITDVVRHLLIINVLVFFGSFILGEPSQYPTPTWGRFVLGIFYPTGATDFFRPYQIVTHMFMHFDIGHLFFNMIGLYFFGPPLESIWGPRRFLFYYLLTGFGALALHFLVKYVELNYMGAPLATVAGGPSMGASGAIFGVLAGYALYFPNNYITLIFPPISLQAKYFVLIYAGIELFLGVRGFNTGVAHFAHLGGAISGFLLIMYWREFGSRL